MGVNNRQRRAAKQRKRARQAPRPDPRRSFDAGPALDGAAVYALVESRLHSAVGRVRGRYADLAGAQARAESLLRFVHPAPALVVHEIAFDLLARRLAAVVGGGWGPSDLVELATRCSDPSVVPTLLTGLYDEMRRNPARGAAWQSLLAGQGEDPRLRFDTAEPLGALVALTALLGQTPLLTADSIPEAPQGETDAHPKLARVRALLAKAESTTFPEEAEALTAKAQELIARYSLEALLAQGRSGSGGDDLVTRRLWLDAPYVGAKASLVSVVADANHCRAAVSERLGFCIVVGSGHDLEAVELLVTSLLVQAHRAMLVHGSQFDRRGASRTRSFRQAFLRAYATRIGQRLAEAGEAVVAEHAASLLPVLRSHDERVTEAFDALVPHTTTRSRTVSNDEGWWAGMAAADQAVLDVRGEITDTA